ncbi:hypothetical protein OG331_43615 [Streptomyces sp. NBC_01017]|uniref:hypothetical protein n=1 Tax=Streptomyces sp. NBC_01017 TaxID=2903721 RepID=UPI0038662D08|nr:hypothetical protein OG331_43615 [Streptomyces sp. NBC_01017]
MATERHTPPYGPGPDGTGGSGSDDWEDEFGFDDRHFVVEDLIDEPDLELPPAVTSAPPAQPPDAGAQGQPRAQ